MMILSANGTTIANIKIDLIPPTPDLRCLSVENGGDVELSWYYPKGLVNAVLDYDIYFAKDINGPYTDIADVSYPDSTFYHTNSDADLSSSYYYMIANGVCEFCCCQHSSISDTLRTIFMEASN